MSAAEETRSLFYRLTDAGIRAAFSDAHVLRRAQLTLHRWSEQECGDGNDHCSWAIERDEDTGIPYRCTYWHNGHSDRWRTPDRKAGALRRVKEVCTRLGIHYYHQSDPRGCALYVSREPLDGSNYTRGIACCA